MQRILPDRPLTQRERYLRYKATHPDRVNATKRNWEVANPEKVRIQKRKSGVSNYERIERNARLYKRYGVTPGQYAEMYDAQGARCAVCGKEETATARGTLRLLCVDHDHVTGEVRALLCRRCNGGLGWFEDDVERMALGIAYLERFRKAKDAS